MPGGRRRATAWSASRCSAKPIAPWVSFTRQVRGRAQGQNPGAEPRGRAQGQSPAAQAHRHHDGLMTLIHLCLVDQENDGLTLRRQPRQPLPPIGRHPGLADHVRVGQKSLDPLVAAVQPLSRPRQARRHVHQVGAAHLKHRRHQKRELVPLLQETLLQETLLQETLLQETLLQETLLQETLLQETLLQETLLQETLLQETLLQE